MRLKAHRVFVSVSLQRLELANPVNLAFAHRRPNPFALGVLDRVFAMAVADSVFGQEIVSLAERDALQMEEDLAKLADLIIVIVESAGTLTELGVAAS